MGCCLTDQVEPLLESRIQLASGPGETDDMVNQETSAWHMMTGPWEERE